VPLSPIVPVENGCKDGAPSVPTEFDFFDIADTAMSVVDTTGHLRRVNQAFSRIVGRSCAELVGLTFSSLADPERFDAIEALMANSIAEKSGESRVISTRHRRPDGAIVWIDLAVRPMLDDQGAVTGIFAQAFDVTALKLAEDEVRRLGTAQRVAHLGSFEQDPESGMLEASTELRRLLGVEASGPMSVGRLMMVVHPDDRAKLGAAIEACFKDHTPVDLVHRLVMADGTIRWVHALAEWTETAEVGRHSVLGTIIDITGRKAAEDTLVFEYTHDSLTGLENRTSFLRTVDRALATAQYQAKHLAVLLLDVDDFKTVNDSLGHAAGDELLVDLSHRLVATARIGDTVARFGGDEFAVLIESGDVSNVAQQVAQRIAETLRVPFIVAEHEAGLSASIGIAVSDLVGDTGALLRDADLAMYVAKHHGKGRYEIADVGMHERALERLNTISDLRHGVEHDEFEVYYQAIVNTQTSAIAGTEALVRWNHPRRGLVLPGSFIELAESSRMIVPIGQGVRREACRQLAAWRKSSLVDDDFYVSVNLSPHQLADHDLVENVARDLEVTGLPARALVLEITESALMGDYDAVLARLLKLKEMGLRIALDDYGTGYSSLARLSELPIDIIKIDKSFIDQICSSDEALVLVKSVVDAAKALGKSTIAEGVEEQGQHDALMELGSTYIQGYLFAKPAPALQAEEVISRLRGRVRELT
jgi:diguanylate cyclase (GGDEF)-like protein/PAS domain S-box-containing protein